MAVDAGLHRDGDHLVPPAATVESPQDGLILVPPRGPLSGTPTLGRRLGRRTWLATTPDGDEVVAAQLSVEPDEALPDIEVPGPAGKHETGHVVPIHGVVRDGDCAWLLYEPVDGVDLERLVTGASLSVEQAYVVAVGVLDALAAVQAHGVDVRLSPGQVLVDRAGGVHLTGWANSLVEPEAPPDAGGGAATAVLRALLIAARRRSSASTDDRKQPLRDEFAAVVDDAEQGGVPIAVLAERLRHLPTASARRQARAELARLVAAVQEQAQPLVGVSPPQPAGGPLRRSRGTRRGWSRLLWVRTTVGLTVLAVLFAVVVAETVFLHGRIIADIRALLPNAPAAGATHKGAPTHPVAALPAASTATSGAVRAIDVRPLHSCTPGSLCRIRVVVRTDGSVARVHWSARAVDRCTGRVRRLSGGTVSVPRGQDVGYAVQSVRMPRAKALALVAVVAQSSPVRSAGAPVPPSGAHC